MTTTEFQLQKAIWALGRILRMPPAAVGHRADRVPPEAQDPCPCAQCVAREAMSDIDKMQTGEYFE
jgi:hypothetical protein